MTPCPGWMKSSRPMFKRSAQEELIGSQPLTTAHVNMQISSHECEAPSRMLRHSGSGWKRVEERPRCGATIHDAANGKGGGESKTNSSQGLKELVCLPRTTRERCESERLNAVILPPGRTRDPSHRFNLKPHQYT